jgi:hypothetical protein
MHIILEPGSSTARVGSVCPDCGARTSLTVDRDRLMSYLRGQPIETAFPVMSRADRAVIETGSCPECMT